MNPHNINITYRRGDSFDFLLLSDVHFDNPKCNRELFFKHLDEARARNARVFIFGDLFCLMQGKYDKRASKSAVRSEHQTDTYLDTVIEDTAYQLMKYADIIELITDGNHETAINSRHETNVLRRLTDLLSHGGNKVAYGPYMGFVWMKFEGVHKSSRRSSILFYDHGHWGGIVSKGTQAASRYQGIAPQADIVYSGHTHDRNMMEMPRYWLRASGEVIINNQIYLKGGTYKEEFLSGSGWAVEKIGVPKNMGGWWAQVSMNKSGYLEWNVSMAK